MSDSDAMRKSEEGTASQAGDKIQEAAQAAMGRASELAGTAGRRAEEAAAALGERVRSAASALRDRGPSEGMLGSATGAVADSLEGAGRYLQEEGLVGMAEDVTELIRRNPIPAMMVGIGIGYLLARVFRR